MRKKILLVVVLYAAGFLSAVYLLGPADSGKYGASVSRAEVIAYKVYAQLRKVVEIANEKASKVGNATTARLAKK